MPLLFAKECQEAIDLAKRAVPEGGVLDARLLVAALYQNERVRAGRPDLARYLTRPEPVRQDVPEKVPLSPDLKGLFGELATSNEPLTVEMLFARLLASEASRSSLLELRLPAEAFEPAASTPIAVESAGGGGAAPPEEPPPKTGWRGSSERAEAIRALSSFGRMLTDQEPPHGKAVEADETLAGLVRTLSKMKRRNAILVGPAGCGKTAIVFELARRLFHGDESLPERLRDLDIFELSPVFLKSGASVVGQYEERVKALLTVLEAHPRIVLFVDEIHSMLQSGMHQRGPFSEANEGFKAALGSGSITCIGCTTTAEYRHYIAPDKALERRFNILHVQPPSAERTVSILRSRRERMEAFHAPLKIPDAMLTRTVELAEQYLPGRSQPDKSIQLLDEACAFCAVADPPRPEVDEPSLIRALEDMLGYKLARTERLTEDELYEKLHDKIVGQDDVLRAISRAVISGLGSWGERSGPRGAFVFAGPTGVGKTETAVLLAKVLGGEHEALIRVDCNTLPTNSNDPGPVLGRLLGAPPGYIGYARGQGGILSRIRDGPESVVLFDEFEKAGAVVGKLLLQIIDDGQIEDNDGEVLDFRRAYLIFTTNAGCSYGTRRLGFRTPEDATAEDAPSADVEAMNAELRALGLGQEFIGRLRKVFVFQGLRPDDIRVVMGRQLEALRAASQLRGFALEWDPEVVEHLSAQWQPTFGVRFATAILRQRVVEQLDLADAQGELKGARRIVLERMRAPPAAGEAVAGLTTRERRDDALVIQLT